MSSHLFHVTIATAILLLCSCHINQLHIICIMITAKNQRNNYRRMAHRSKHNDQDFGDQNQKQLGCPPASNEYLYQKHLIRSKALLFQCTTHCPCEGGFICLCGVKGSFIFVLSTMRPEGVSEESGFSFPDRGSLVHKPDRTVSLCEQTKRTNRTFGTKPVRQYMSSISTRLEE